jgi:hypothetical protein
MKGTPFLPGYEYCNNNNQSKNTHFNQELDEEFWDRFKEYLKVTHREKVSFVDYHMLKNIIMYYWKVMQKIFFPYQTRKDYKL